MTKKSDKVELDPVLLLGFGALLVVAGAVIYGVLNSDSLTSRSTVDSIAFSTNNSQQLEPEPIDTRKDINAILAAAGVATIDQWSGAPECGRADEFIGTYRLSHNTTFVTQAEATRLRDHVTSLELPIDEYGSLRVPASGSFAVTQSNWHIDLSFDNEDIVTMRASVTGLASLPDDITTSSTLCR